MLTACTVTPRQQFAVTQDVFIAAVQTVVQLRIDGVIPPDEYAANVHPAVVAGDLIIDAFDNTSQGLEAFEHGGTVLDALVESGVDLSQTDPDLLFLLDSHDLHGVLLRVTALLVERSSQ